MRWSQAALAAYPSIASACQAVEQRNGKTFVRLEGVVESVKNEGKRIRVDFEDGKPLTFSPDPRTTLYLDGERAAFGEVRDGMRLNFYVPEDRLQAELQPDPARVAFIIFPLDPVDLPVASPPSEQLAMSELPETASLWPLAGAAGLALVLLGSIASVRRRRMR